MTAAIPVFDGHNDVLLRLYKSKSADPVADFLAGEQAGHLDLQKAKAGSFAGGFFALYSPAASKPAAFFEQMTGGRYALPLPDPLTLEEARTSVVAELAILLQIVRASHGAVAICTTTAEIRSAMARGALAVVIHLEGAEAIDEKLQFLEILYAAGLRSIGPVWSRTTIFGHGVPFHFPAGPDLGEGLTAAGERLVAACNDMKIMIDLSHITEKGFWDVARLSKAPLVATHSNAHALCPSPRNLTDRQLAAIRDTEGMVGLNFATCFLRPDGAMRPDTDIDLMVQQIDYLLEKVGEGHVGLGSDFDGATVPEKIGSVAGLQVLFSALRDKGYSESLLTKLGATNWLDLLQRTIC
ncbi:membrane dipeptidase [Bradyrhizobium sp. NFR13]|jgi:membrane dipeptidase|uniref:dipeptidase n=1 Tax=Bradyrhizobium sp. NFR13 TaxID=1566285 RepID=UPI0008EEF766|nr:dipeptidase [Bradyrhizobium sp. NFR13]SFL91849.1 membrane dipeptidase [Bradyrhizobium sp. NFR13]